MTVESLTSRVTYTGSGTVGPFTIPYYFLENDDLIVTKITIATGAETLLVLNTDYTLTGAGDEDGGELTLVATLSSSFQLEIARSPDLLQETDYPPSDPFPAESHERALDKIHMILMRHRDEFADIDERLDDLEDRVTVVEVTGGGSGSGSLTVNNFTVNTLLTVLGDSIFDTATFNDAVTFNSTVSLGGTMTVTSGGSIVFAGGDIDLPAGSVDIADLSQEVLDLIALSASGSGAPYSVRGFIGFNNTVTPNTQFDLTADTVVVADPSTSAVVVLTAPANVTINISTAGPIANGRDQAGAFTAGSWVHFYYIYNGTTLSGIASAAAPSVGPTLPTGYTKWAYATSVYFTAGSVLKAVRCIGATNYYTDGTFAAGNALTNGSQTSITSVNVSALVPPNASRFTCFSGTTLSSSGGAATFATYLYGSTTVPLSANTFSVAGISGDVTFSFGETTFPNISQTFGYYTTVTTGSAPKVNVTLTSYEVPNGDN